MKVGEIIDSKIYGGERFFVYRKPREVDVHIGEEGRYVIEPWEDKRRGDAGICEDGLPEETAKERYLEDVEGLIEELRERGGKVVISRVVRGRLDSGKTWGRVYEKLCERFGEAFCYVYSEPEWGMWMGASPEALMCVREEEMRTMALAGTKEQGEEWDEKNRKEQGYVVEYLREKLGDIANGVEEGVRRTLTYGGIEHLCTEFRGVLKEGISGLEAARYLSPTPAVCGVPSEDAKHQIERIERFDRRCYSGFVGVQEGYDFMSYVNLRCFQFKATGEYAVYVGSGITGDSRAEEEWEETRRKAEELLAEMR